MNRLANETSPYLRQHEANPVDWYPWGEEAFARALELNRPLFISIGYSACHWCHVMAHESFEDAVTAQIINDGFVAVKVDREERPDVDAIYLDAAQTLSGGGGWPLTVFANPEGRPFFAGTYFPKVAKYGTPSFSEVLAAVREAWTTRREEVDRQADALTAAVGRRLEFAADPADRSDARALVTAAFERIAAIYDPEHPGFGRAPKFAHAPSIELLFHADRLGIPTALDMATSALVSMASGGIYDHLGGGFARYSVDQAWQVPHFEKMLYDQASLARCYLHAWQITGDARYRQVLDETLGYVLRELAEPGGGISSAEDADSEGEEGRFYVWTRPELVAVLGEERAATAASWYGVTDDGNFEGSRTVLHRPVIGDLVRPPEIEAIRIELLAARNKRPHPGVDDKVLTEWNAMAASVLAEAAAATGSSLWHDAALETAEFLLATLRNADNRWLRSHARGRGSHLAVAADYAWLVDLFTRLGELTGEPRFTHEAVATADQLIELFGAPDGGWFTTGSDATPLIVRPRDRYDGVVPAAGSIAALALARLGAVTGADRFTLRAEQTIAAAGSALSSGPATLPTLIEAACLIDFGAIEIVIIGERLDLAERAARLYAPERVLVLGSELPSPLTEGRTTEGAYVCRRGACLAPVSDLAALDDAIRAAARATLGDA